MADERKPARSERRAAARLPCALETACLQATDGGSAWDAQVVDISTTGVGLLLKRRFEPGTLLSFRLEGPSGGQTFNALARVMNARRQPAGGWLLGCALVGELDAAQLRAFRASAQALADSTAEALRRELTRDRDNAKPDADD
jgi:hypothetical protein